MNRYSTTNPYSLIPFTIIVQATNGEMEAMNYILSHYTGYIMELTKRPILNELGYLEVGIDYEMKNRLEAKLITKILDFDLS